MSVIIGILIVLAGVGVWYWFFFRNREYTGIWKALDQECGIPKREYCMFKFRQVTPSGASVISTVELPANALQNLDIGVRNQLARQGRQFPGWAAKTQPSDYAFVVIDPMGTSVESLPGAPLIKVQGVTAAGTCVGLRVFGPSAAKRDYIVLPHQEKQNWQFNDYWMRSAWNESEHIRERFNDVNEFMKYVGPNDVHPHVDFPDMAVLPAV